MNILISHFMCLATAIKSSSASLVNYSQLFYVKEIMSSFKIILLYIEDYIEILNVTSTIKLRTLVDCGACDSYIYNIYIKMIMKKILKLKKIDSLTNATAFKDKILTRKNYHLLIRSFKVSLCADFLRLSKIWHQIETITFFIC